MVKAVAILTRKGKSEGEVMGFARALMTELYRHLGADTDVPAGDIGVGGRSRLYGGMMKKLSNNTACVFTGKGLSFGGSLPSPGSHRLRSGFISQKQC